MAKPALRNLAAGVEGWDAIANDNIAIQRDAPMPVKEYTTVAGLPAAGSYDRCIAFANDTNQGWRMYLSDGTIWRALGDSDRATYGAAPARTGRVRFTAGEGAKFRTQADDADRDLLKTDSSNRVILGDPASEITVPQGGSTALARIKSVAHVDTTAAGNVGTGEDTLMTFTLSASALARNGQGVRVRARGNVANNANAKTLKLHFGSVAILTFTPTLSQAGKWSMEAEIFRTGASAQDYHAEVWEKPGTAGDMAQGNLTQNDAATIQIKLTGEGVSNNDIVQELFEIEFIG